LGGSRLAPEMIRRVGHVRVFAALGSLISAALILFPVVADPWFWTLMRLVIGFGFSGVYVTAESWLNNTASNETRGQTLSAYMIVQMIGIVSGQAILAGGNPEGYILFIIPSVLVSISFAPILLSIAPTPAFSTTKSMSLRQLFVNSPLTFVSMTILGSVFAALFGMGSVYATEVGLSVGQVSTFIAVIFIGAMVLQYPIGWASDRMDRRQLIFGVAVTGAVASTIGYVAGTNFNVLLALAFIMGGTTNPLYSLLIAYLNDYLQPEDMAAASGGLIFINGLGAIAGPIVTGYMMGAIGAQGFWLYMAVLMFAISAYSLYRMTQRAATPVDETNAYVNVMPTATTVAVEAAQEWAIEHAEDAETPLEPVWTQ
jgi:MFS family permease